MVEARHQEIISAIHAFADAEGTPLAMRHVCGSCVGVRGADGAALFLASHRLRLAYEPVVLPEPMARVQLPNSTTPPQPPGPTSSTRRSRRRTARPALCPMA
ncbi:hypothetical protein [Saccharopolyspora phatthalungensis]|uniref:Uncharacterized protein n=1 Tax=Saccharopolyspora phatthalungensis TaxID=664693 RepID=A0A840QBI1_9PSEU|nr:hypothetical protein [Saccharopolyspora phatthalungensis]MBB5157297.1 hypothetical protein [Saccharopolyspora phatthalungensis]